MKPIQRICVYCGASDGHHPRHVAAAQKLGVALAQQNYGLVYGGGSMGIMGALARAVDKAGGSVHGIIPAPLTPKEVSGPPIGRLEIVSSMHERKARMVDLADAFIALPGGFGTLEELFETITWVQLGIHRKPIGLLNVSGFFDPLVALILHHIEEGFIRDQYRSLLVVEEDAETLLSRLEAHESPDGIVRWVTPEQS